MSAHRMLPLDGKLVPVEPFFTKEVGLAVLDMRGVAFTSNTVLTRIVQKYPSLVRLLSEQDALHWVQEALDDLCFQGVLELHSLAESMCYGTLLAGADLARILTKRYKSNILVYSVAGTTAFQE